MKRQGKHRNNSRAVPWLDFVLVFLITIPPVGVFLWWWVFGVVSRSNEMLVGLKVVLGFIALWGAFMTFVLALTLVFLPFFGILILFASSYTSPTVDDMGRPIRK